MTRITVAIIEAPFPGVVPQTFGCKIQQSERQGEQEAEEQNLRYEHDKDKACHEAEKHFYGSHD